MSEAVFTSPSTRGRLKIFFGAVAGVGKTYAMLEEGRAKAAEGIDVVVGYAEPSGRPETEGLLLGMEILRPRVVDLETGRQKELDLDAALARKPKLILVDELAHTNALGLRHQKRWQDVMDLLDAGVDVYTTLNVQHLESVNDIVRRITGMTVLETLPDSVLEAADEVELVDTSPEELLERFREGKVYRLDQPALTEGVRQFFTKGNLIALRELALRQTAERVDAQMQDFRQRNAVRQTWAATERILVSVGPSPLSARLIRAARRLAAGLRATWIAAYVETPASDSLSTADRDRVAQHLRLAQELGGEAVTLSGNDVSEELVSYARNRNVTKIVVGKPQRPRWREGLRGSIVDQLVRMSGAIDIYVIRGGDEDEEPSPEPVSDDPSSPFPFTSYFWAGGVMTLCTVFGSLLRISDTNVLMIYLLGIVWIATQHGRAAAIFASLLGVALFDFTFVKPYFSLWVADRQYVVTFVVMLATAILISALTDRVRRQAQAARRRERETAALYGLSRELAAQRDTKELCRASAEQIADVFDSEVVILKPRGGHGLEVEASRQTSFVIDEHERAVALWVQGHGKSAGLGTSTLSAAIGFYVPLLGSRGTVGVLGIRPREINRFDNLEQLRQLQAFANQLALAIERANLAAEAQVAWERVEAEFLRNTLLSSVSHDLRTPLAAITGAASTLVAGGKGLGDAAQRDLAETICSEAERMERIVNNLLDMTRLESGGLQLKKEWQPLVEVVGAVLHALGARLAGREVKTDLPEDLPMVPFDATAIGQVLTNLIDNAIDYTPAGSPIEISARAIERGVELQVCDRGPGLPAGNEERVFQKFFRANGNRGRRGIGLGLAICRGIVEAHGGKIIASNRAGGGAVFRMVLPVEGKPPEVDGEL